MMKKVRTGLHFWLLANLLARLSCLQAFQFQIQPLATTFHPVVSTKQGARLLVASPPPIEQPSKAIAASVGDNDSGAVGKPDNISAFNMVLNAIGSSTTVVVAAAFMVALAWLRDALMVSFFIGAISNGILSKILKRIINQTRPAELEKADLKLKPNDNGMPSSHAMALGFISTFTALCVPWAKLLLAVYAVVSLTYRVRVNLHTWQQVAVGATLGSFNGLVWHRLCNGDNPWSINVMNWVATVFLDETGHLPIAMLIVPALLGAATVSSVERRIGAWLKKNKDA